MSQTLPEALADMDLITKFRLSVSAVKPAEWDHILKLAGP